MIITIQELNNPNNGEVTHKVHGVETEGGHIIIIITDSLKILIDFPKIIIDLFKIIIDLFKIIKGRSRITIDSLPIIIKDHKITINIITTHDTLKIIGVREITTRDLEILQLGEGEIRTNLMRNFVSTAIRLDISYETVKTKRKE